MAAIAGYNGSIKLGATGGTNAVAEVKSWEIPLASDMYDVSAMGSNWKAYLPGLIGAAAKCDVFFDPTDTNGQLAMQQAQLNGTQVTVNLYLSSTHYYSGAAYIKQIDVKNAVNSTVDASLDIQFTGPITYN